MTGQDCICWGRGYLKDRPRRNELPEVSASENRSSFRSNALRLPSIKPFGITGVGGGIRTLGHWNHKSGVQAMSAILNTSN